MPSINSAFGTDLIQSFSFIAGASSTTNYVYGTATQFKGTKFFIEMLNETTEESDVFDVNATKLSTDEPRDTIFGKTGDRLNYRFNIEKSGSDIILKVINNESDDIKVKAIRITS